MNRPVRGVDKSLPVECMPPRTCSRRLKPGQVKRYTSAGPLIAYAICCPGCGFIENWPDLDKERGFREDPPLTLVAMLKPFKCMLCHRNVTIEAGIVEARSGVPV